MNSSSWLKLLQQHRVIAVVRSHHFEIGRQMAKAAAAGGMRLIEITWNTDRAPELITQLREELPDAIIGTGTLFNLEEQQQAIDSGAQFLFTPHTSLAMIQAAVAAKIPIIPGALSPTEIIMAWQGGASCVKVFPISAVGGAAYIQSLQGPLGKIPLIPTGGVTLENAQEFIAAGAIAVGVAGTLFSPTLVNTQNWESITHQAEILVKRLTNGLKYDRL